MRRINVGAIYKPDYICEFTVWSPFALSVDLQFVFPEKYTVSMDKVNDGYWNKKINGIQPGSRYFYLIDGTVRKPDPASCYQPEGVDGPSETVDHETFIWSDSRWQPPPLEKMIIYEIHTGTFTPEGTLEAIIPVLAELKNLGITTIELMPVAQFPGDRNWGYDGVYPYAVQNSYGGPDSLKRLCDACHKTGLALFLDVVYNHSGPEGNCLSSFGPYFTEKYKSPWGETMNFDDEYSDGVRNYFIMNARHWFENYHIDGLRLDAVHAIYDLSAKHILEEISDDIKSFADSKGKSFYLVAESTLNDNRIVKEKKYGGYGIDAQWTDDFHHSIHALLTGEKERYYVDFGRLIHLQKAFTEGFVYNGDYSLYRKRDHGNSSTGIPGYKMVVFIQNHDQTGNRMNGERITSIAGFEAHKLAAGTMMAAPYVPLLFMGEEYAETAPFIYFISHDNPGLAEAVRNGRKREFELYGNKEEPPDPRNPEIFEKSKLRRNLIHNQSHSAMLQYYSELIKIRKNTPALNQLIKKNVTFMTDDSVRNKEKVLVLKRVFGNSEICAVMNYDSTDNFCRIGGRGEHFTKIIDSADYIWHGPGPSAPYTINEKRNIKLKPFNFIIFSVKRSAWNRIKRHILCLPKIIRKNSINFF